MCDIMICSRLADHGSVSVVSIHSVLVAGELCGDIRVVEDDFNEFIDGAQAIGINDTKVEFRSLT